MLRENSAGDGQWSVESIECFGKHVKKGKNGTLYSTLADCHLAILRSGLSYLFSEKLPFLSDTMISTRRFACRPAEVLSVATG